jgi:hypothetical protein
MDSNRRALRAANRNQSRSLLLVNGLLLMAIGLTGFFVMVAARIFAR